ncbi:MAG TPA: MATE family efflux transporter, partial [Geobacteraceae bacterium]
AAPFLFRMLGASGAYLDLAVTYMNTIFGGAVCFFFNQMCNAGLNSSGDTKGFRNFLVVGFFINLVLDPWFLYGGLGLPAMGLPGIGRSTVAVQLVGNLYLLARVRRTGLLAGFRPGQLLPKPGTYGQLARQGFPASLNMLTVALGVFVITWFLSRFGHEAVAAYGIAARLEQMALLPVMGLNIATLTLVAQNSGARNYRRVRETIRTALGAGVALTVAVAGVIFAGAPWLVALFSNDAAVVAIGASYLHVAAFIFCAYVILYINVFALQGLKLPLFAVVIGIYRQIAAPLAVFYLLAVRLGYGVRGIWWGIFLVTWSAALISLAYMRRVARGLPADGEDPVRPQRASSGSPRKV